jgi:hypothetical protein
MGKSTMSLSAYISTLVPSFETRNLKADFQANSEKLSGHIIPAYQKVAGVFNHKYKWQSKVLQNVEKELRSSLVNGPIKMHQDESLLEMTLAVYNNMTTTLPFIKDQIDKTFGAMFTNVGLTFTKGNLIQYGEVADFTIYYSQVLINYLTSNELMRLEGRTSDVNLPKGDEEYLLANSLIFANAMRIMAYPVAELKAQLRKIPDMTVDSETEGSAKIMVGASNLDPMGFASVPFPISLIYHFRLNRAEAQVEELEAMKTEERIVEYRIILIKQRMASGQGDAAIEAELAIQEDRLFKLRKKRSDREASYGV